MLYGAVFITKKIRVKQKKKGLTNEKKLKQEKWLWKTKLPYVPQYKIMEAIKKTVGFF